MIVYLCKNGSFICNVSEEEFEEAVVAKEIDGDNGVYQYAGTIKRVSDKVIGWLFSKEAATPLALKVDTNAYYVDLGNETMAKYSKKEAKKVYEKLYQFRHENKI